jgi:predicted nucleic acid-binding protein
VTTEQLPDLLVLDTNVWIAAADTRVSEAAALLTCAAERGARIGVSKHSLVELTAGSIKYGGSAESLARAYETIPYHPVGRIDELLGTITQLSGTFDQMRVNEALRVRLGNLAKAGTDIRDRGAVIDALQARATYFVTSDRGLVAPAPRARIEAELPIRIRTPAEMLRELP